MSFHEFSRQLSAFSLYPSGLIFALLALSSKRANAGEMCAYLLTRVGEAGRDMFNSWGFRDDDNKNIDLLVQTFGRRRHIARIKNYEFARYLFQERRQRQGERLTSPV